MALNDIQLAQVSQFRRRIGDGTRFPRLAAFGLRQPYPRLRHGQRDGRRRRVRQNRRCR